MDLSFLWEGLLSITWQQAVMYVVGIVLIYLAIKKDYEPALLLPMGFGAILVNLPLSGVINQQMEGIGVVNGIIEWLYNVGIEASEALPILLFIGIGAMIDFGPLLSNPVMFLFGAGAQFGIFAAVLLAALLGFDLKDAAKMGREKFPKSASYTFKHFDKNIKVENLSLSKDHNAPIKKQKENATGSDF